MSRAIAVVDLSALERNVRVLVDRVHPSEVMLAVKANAYGHGIYEVALAGLKAGASSLAVLDIESGLALRDSGITVPVLAWLHGRDADFRAAAQAGVELGISARWQLDAIAADRADLPAVVHLKVDTGLSRNGATPEEWPALVEQALVLQHEGVVRIRAAWSHLADASVEDDQIALQRFETAVAVAEQLGARFDVLHLAASSAGWRMPAARFSFVRFGIAAYGISPFDDESGAQLGLTPVMSLRAPITELRVDGSRYVRAAVGFGDGIQTLGRPRAHVQLNGVRARVIRIEVDSMVVDPGEQRVRLGDQITVFGPGAEGEPTAEEWADWSGTIGDEIVAAVSARVPRHYLG